jgi:hypothetical protein
MSRLRFVKVETGQDEPFALNEPTGALQNLQNHFANALLVHSDDHSNHRSGLCASSVNTAIGLVLVDAR